MFDQYIAPQKRELLFVLVISVVVGAISVLPHILATRELGSDYRGYPFIFQANEDLYMARIQEVIDGYGAVGSPMLYEYKDAWPQVAPTSEFLWALPSLVFGVPLPKIIVATKFFLPALLFVFTYALISVLLRERDSWTAHTSAAAGGLLVTLGYDAVDYANLFSFLTEGLHVLVLSVWTRPVNPISGILFLIPLAFIVWRTLEGSRWLFLAGGVLLGMMIGYFFSWFIGLGICGLSFVYALYTANIGAAIRLGILIVMSTVLQIPYWYHTLSSLGASEGGAHALKNGAIFTHVPILNKFLFAGSLAFIICSMYEWYTHRKLEPWWWFCSIMLLASWAAYTEQVITGITVWPYHFVQYTIPLVMIVGIIVGHNVIGKYFPFLWKTGLMLVVCVSLSLGVGSAKSYVYGLEEFRSRQNFMPIFSWLNENAQKDCVVLVREESELLAFQIPAFTHCNTYTTTYTPYGIPDERRMHSLLVILRLRDIPPRDLRGYLESHPELVNGYLYHTIAQSISSELTAETLVLIDKVIPQYERLYREDIMEVLKTYRIDYLLTTSHPPPPGLLLEKVAASGSLTLFRLH